MFSVGGDIPRRELGYVTANKLKPMVSEKHRKKIDLHKHSPFFLQHCFCYSIAREWRRGRGDILSVGRDITIASWGARQQFNWNNGE